MNLLFLGASNTDCGHCFTPDNLGNGYVKIIRERLDSSSISIINGGSDGFTFPRILEKYLAFYSKTKFSGAVVLGGINEVGMLSDNGLSPQRCQALLEGSGEALKKLLLALFSNETREIYLLEPFLFSRPSRLLAWTPAYEAVRSRILSCMEPFKRALPLFCPAAGTSSGSCQMQGHGKCICRWNPSDLSGAQPGSRMCNRSHGEEEKG